jgi:hypothetical protein
MTKTLDALPHEEIVANLDKQIALLKYQLERLEYLRFALADPGTYSRLALAMTQTWEETIQHYASKLAPPPATGEVPSPDQGRRGLTNFDRVQQVFRRNGNAWLGIDEIVAHSHIKPTVLRDIIYKTHKQQFERADSPAGGRSKVFRLRQIETTE